MGEAMICTKCGQRFSPDWWHTEGFDPQKCSECQSSAVEPDYLPEETGCDLEQTEYELGGES
jgi:hypothetical protein